MSSWLNFNESLSSLKGQISTFANNVLAEEEGDDRQGSNAEHEELKRICLQQQQEIERLRGLEQNNKEPRGDDYVNGSNEESSWDWNTPDESTIKNRTKENIPHLKSIIKELETEKHHLVEQLEQLDNENQQNLTELVRKKDQVQDENNEIKEKFRTLKQQNIVLAQNEEKLRSELEKLKTNCSNDIPSVDGHVKYENLLKNYQKLQSQLEETTKELSVLKSTHSVLEKTLTDLKVNSEKELKFLSDDLKKSDAEKKNIYSELQKAKEFLKASEIKSKEDTENCDKLASILDTYEKQVSSLKAQLSETAKSDSKKIEDLEISKKKLQEELETTLDMVKLLETENTKIKQHLLDANNKEKLESTELRYLLEEKLKEIRHLQEKMDENCLSDKEHFTDSSIEERLHKTYINIITENVRKYINPETPHEPFETPSDPYVVEFSKQIQNIFNLLSDLKTKCENLEKQNLDISQEKTQLLTEKNLEIEKLMQNSENLSQDVIRKNKEIKALEEEWDEQRLNISELEVELQDYKNFKLDTISESNEDNVVMLERQLEHADKKIKELEQIVERISGKSPEKILLEKTQFEGDAKTFGEPKDQKTENDYVNLLKLFDDLKVDYDLAQKELKNTLNELELTDKENEELRSELDKLKTDFDNSLDNADYQLTEANITIDTLREEINSSKTETDKILEANKKLYSLKNELEKNIVDTKTELNDAREQLLNEENKRREVEFQIRTLTEKLQNSKMAETSLKLQYDTLSKDYNLLVETKKNMELTLTDTKKSIDEYEKNYSQLLEKYDAVLLRCEELNANIMKGDNQILQLNGEIERFAEENESLGKFIKEKENLLMKLQSRNQELESLLEKKSLQESIKEKDNNNALEGKKIIDELENKNQDLETHLNQKCQEDVIAINNNAVSENVQPRIGELEFENFSLKDELAKVQTLFKQSNDNILNLQNQLQELTNSRSELIAMVTTKNQESLTYYNEIQRLTQVLQAETDKCIKLESQLAKVQNSVENVEKLTDQNNFLKEKCDILAKNLLEEQSKYHKLVEEKSTPSEKEINLNKQLERLQSHLMEAEEHYTQELLQAEQQNAELRAKMEELEQREKDSSTMYTSVSIRANQQVESLQSQLQMVTNQRDELRKKISDAEDQNSKQAAALANLQFVLEQFQRDKEKDVHQETERIRRQISAEKKVQEGLKTEISTLKSQLEESKQGLLAASRLSDQLEFTKNQNVALREEVNQLQEKLGKSENSVHKLMNQTDGKVEKSLVKSLLVGFLSSSNTNTWNKDQVQILKIIATVLDFNQQDHEKVKLNQIQGSWLGSLLFGQGTQQNMSQESLSQAFIKFLESESKPRVVPSLLESSNVANEAQKSTISNTSSSTTSRKSSRSSPIVLSEIVLPTFDDFGRSRNSSSILKDVLKDNSNS